MAYNVLRWNDVFWPSEHWHGILAGYGHLTAFIEGKFNGEYRPKETLFKRRDLLEDKWSDLRYRFLLRDPIAFTSWLYLVYPDERGTIDNLPVFLNDLDAALQRAEAANRMIWVPPAERPKHSVQLSRSFTARCPRRPKAARTRLAGTRPSTAPADRHDPQARAASPPRPPAAA